MPCGRILRLNPPVGQAMLLKLTVLAVLVVRGFIMDFSMIETEILTRISWRELGALALASKELYQSDIGDKLKELRQHGILLGRSLAEISLPLLESRNIDKYLLQFCRQEYLRELYRSQDSVTAINHINSVLVLLDVSEQYANLQGVTDRERRIELQREILRTVEIYTDTIQEQFVDSFVFFSFVSVARIDTNCELLHTLNEATKWLVFEYALMNGAILLTENKFQIPEDISELFLLYSLKKGILDIASGDYMVLIRALRKRFGWKTCMMIYNKLEYNQSWWHITPLQLARLLGASVQSGYETVLLKKILPPAYDLNPGNIKEIEETLGLEYPSYKQEALLLLKHLYF